MRKTKKRRSYEVYEKYWKFTAALTDIYSVKFSNSLSVIVNYIDRNRDSLLNECLLDGSFAKSPYYKELQDILVSCMGFEGKDATLSARKLVNLFVKIGFIEPYLEGYHTLVKKFLKSSTHMKKSIFSKIFYENSSLASSVTVDNKRLKHIEFFINTLEYNSRLSINDLKALMVTDIENYSKGFLTRAELDSQLKFAIAINFEDRKYNQIQHLVSYLQNFADLNYNKFSQTFSFEVDLENDINYKEKNNPRDRVLHRLFKQELISESCEIFGKEVCFCENLPYKVLIASHIIPYKHCIDQNKLSLAYNPNNGLLLSQRIDSYFDKFEISFDNDGIIMFNKNIDSEIKEIYRVYKLDKRLLNDERLANLEYHRLIFNKKNGVL